MNPNDYFRAGQEGRELCCCDHIVCVCAEKRKHKKKCRYRISISCPIGIPCDHGRDVCPECDACNCDDLV